MTEKRLKTQCPYCKTEQFIATGWPQQNSDIIVTCKECHNKFRITYQKPQTKQHTNTQDKKNKINESQNNDSLPENTFKIECPQCGHIYNISETTRDAIISSKSKLKCKQCGMKFELPDLSDINKQNLNDGSDITNESPQPNTSSIREFDSRSPQPTSAATRQCPFCGADIPIQALKCKFCGEWISQIQSQQPGKKGSDGYATASLILGLVGLFLVGFITGILAIVFGSIALGNPKTTRKGSAKAGIILGIIDIIGWILYISFIYSWI